MVKKERRDSWKIDNISLQQRNVSIRLCKLLVAKLFSQERYEIIISTNILEKSNLRCWSSLFQIKMAEKEREVDIAINLINFYCAAILYRTVGYRYAGFMGQKRGWHRVKWKMILRMNVLFKSKLSMTKDDEKRIEKKREKERENEKIIYKYHFIISSHKSSFSFKMIFLYRKDRYLQF